MTAPQPLAPPSPETNRLASLKEQVPVDATDELIVKIAAAITATLARPGVEQARQAANEAGLAKARVLLADALDILGNAQETRRRCEADARQAADTLATAEAEAAWLLDGCFQVRSNKTYLAAMADGTPIAEADQRSMTADERGAWKQQHARTVPAVAAALAAARFADNTLAAARDDVALAERRLSACKADLAASVALLQTLATALGGGRS